MNYNKDKIDLERISLTRFYNRYYTIFSLLFVITPLILFPIFAYQISNWWVLIGIVFYFLGAMFSRVRMFSLILIAIGLGYHFFINKETNILLYTISFAAGQLLYMYPEKYKRKYQQSLMP